MQKLLLHCAREVVSDVSRSSDCVNNHNLTTQIVSTILREGLDSMSRHG